MDAASLSSETLLPCIFLSGGVFPLDFVDCWAHHHGPGSTVRKTIDAKIDCFCGMLRGTKTKLAHVLASSLPAMSLRTSRASGSEHRFDISAVLHHLRSATKTYDETREALRPRTHEIQLYRHQNAEISFLTSPASSAHDRSSDE
jgi:hypothetical protein